jgi:hypothetical protein
MSNCGGAGQCRWLHIFMGNNVVASLMQGTMDLGTGGMCCTDCALFNEWVLVSHCSLGIRRDGL